MDIAQYQDALDRAAMSVPCRDEAQVEPTVIHALHTYAGDSVVVRVLAMILSAKMNQRGIADSYVTGDEIHNFMDDIDLAEIDFTGVLGENAEAVIDVIESARVNGEGVRERFVNVARGGRVHAAADNIVNASKVDLKILPVAHDAIDVNVWSLLNVVSSGARAFPDLAISFIYAKLLITAFPERVADGTYVADDHAVIAKAWRTATGA